MKQFLQTVKDNPMLVAGGILLLGLASYEALYHLALELWCIAYGLIY